MGAQWQPIETAPKDRTIVLVFAPDIYGHEDEVPRFKIRTAYYEPEPVGSMHWYGTGLTTHYQPTHWQPLPAPPNAASPADAGLLEEAMKVMEQMRREWGAFTSISGETIVQADALLERAKGETHG